MTGNHAAIYPSADNSAPIALLCMAYGTPATKDDIAPFYTHIRGGRPPTPELLAELVGRYEAIGGSSPLMEYTQAQAQGIAEVLSAQIGRAVVPLVGMKHAPPFIHEVVGEIASQGFPVAVGLTLTPQYSRLSVGAYIQAARDAAAALSNPPEKFVFVEDWHVEPDFIAALSRRVAAALTAFELPAEQAARDVPVIFTAHSLPERILQEDDPYPDQIRSTGAAIAQQVGLATWMCAYQSAGRSAVPWLGPDVLVVMRQLADQGHRRVVVCPVGFVADHLEVLYDIDIECQAEARSLGMTLVRTASLNAAEDFVAALAGVVQRRLGGRSA